MYYWVGSWVFFRSQYWPQHKCRVISENVMNVFKLFIKLYMNISGSSSCTSWVELIFIYIVCGGRCFVFNINKFDLLMDDPYLTLKFCWGSILTFCVVEEIMLRWMHFFMNICEYIVSLIWTISKITASLTIQDK